MAFKLLVYSFKGEKAKLVSIVVGELETCFWADHIDETMKFDKGDDTPEVRFLDLSIVPSFKSN